MADVQKTIRKDAASDFYIHLKSDSFMNPRNRALINAYNNKEVGDVYAQNAAYIRRRYLKSKGYLDDLQGNVQYRDEMNAILDLYATTNSSATNGILASYIQQSSNEIVEKIKGVQSMALGIGAMVGGNSNLTVKQMDDLKNYVKQLKDLISSIKQYDTKAINYAADSAGVTRATMRKRTGLVNNPDAVYLMSANQTGQTSLQNLARKVKEMESLLSSIPKGNGGSVNAKVSYVDAGSGKTRVRNFSDIFGGIPTQLTNIQGGIGEMMAFVVAEQGIKNNLLDALKTDRNTTITMNTAGSDVVKNQLLGLSATSVSDTKLKVDFTKDGASATMNIGISSKAIFTNPKERKNKSASTSFGTTNVAGLLARAGLWEKQFEYLFLNLMAPHTAANGNKVDLYSESLGMRRYLAARAMKHMLGGLEGDQGDTVYFLKYQDAMYPVEDYFYGLMEAAYSGTASVPLASISTARQNIDNSRVSQQSGESPADAAYRRSVAVRGKILNLVASVSRSMGRV